MLSQNKQSLLKIQKIIESLEVPVKNRTGDIYINVIHNEFIQLNDIISIPKISVKELDYETGLGIMEAIAPCIPEFLLGHVILQERKPVSDQHALHFVKKIPGKVMDFIHILKIDLKFSGDSSTIIEQGGTDYYPSFRTDRLYYKSRIIPVMRIPAGQDIGLFEPIRVRDFDRVESDQYFHTFAVFEDVNSAELSIELCTMAGADLFPVSLNLYPFLVYDFFTACLNVLYPSSRELEYSIKIFEPLFVYLYGKYKSIDLLAELDHLKNQFTSELNINENKPAMKDPYIEILKTYFSRFVLERDDDLALKGWWRFMSLNK